MNAERSSSSASAIAATSTDRGDPPEHVVPLALFGWMFDIEQSG
jgi:hypothetical protein